MALLAGPGLASAGAAALLALQRTHGNQAVQRLVADLRGGPAAGADTARPRPPPVSPPPAQLVQRGIRKEGGGGLYQRPPDSYKGDKISDSVKKELKKIIDNNEMYKSGKHYTLLMAIRAAKKRVKASGRFATGRAGTRIKTTADMVTHLQNRGADTTMVENKFNTVDPALWTNLFTRYEIVESDFAATKVTGGGQQVWSNFSHTMMTTVPGLARTISGLNEIADQVQTDASQQIVGSKYKGTMFEYWTLQNVLASAGTRVSFAQQGAMRQQRISDGYQATTQTLWDMKHYYGQMGQSTDNYQGADYNEILQNGYASTSGQTVAAVNYLFPTLAAAKANTWLATTYGFGVYYVESPSTLKKHM